MLLLQSTHAVEYFTTMTCKINMLLWNHQPKTFATLFTKFTVINNRVTQVFNKAVKVLRYSYKAHKCLLDLCQWLSSNVDVKLKSRYSLRLVGCSLFLTWHHKAIL